MLKIISTCGLLCQIVLIANPPLQNLLPTLLMTEFGSTVQNVKGQYISHCRNVDMSLPTASSESTKDHLCGASVKLFVRSGPDLSLWAYLHGTMQC